VIALDLVALGFFGSNEGECGASEAVGPQRKVHGEVAIFRECSPKSLGDETLFRVCGYESLVMPGRCDINLTERALQQLDQNLPTHGLD
jgi:hypothetical protein